MRQTGVHAVVVSLLLALPVLAFNRTEWKLVFEDNFDRKEVGPDWIINGKAEIVDGRLKYGVEGDHIALINRHFGPDVCIELDAQPAPEKPACDLSLALSCAKQTEQYGYFLSFGGNFNTLNQLTGGRALKGFHEWYPKKTIQPGKVHHLCGIKEGKKITMEVDGEVLMVGTDDDPLGGPGFDMIGPCTWNGMLLDNVRVYERKTKHPDTPRYVDGLKGLPFVLSADRKLSVNKQWPKLNAAYFSSQTTADDPQQTARALELYNAGKPREAEQEFLKLTDPQMRTAGAAFCIGHLNYEASIDEFQSVGQMLIDLAAAHPNDERLQDYGELGRRVRAFSVLRFEGLPNGELAATAAINMGWPNNPVYDKACFYKARMLRAHSMEGAGYAMNVPMGMFKELIKWYPANQSLREILGEKIPWGEELVDDTSSAPAWARSLRELYARQCRVVNWWFTKRQYKSGELGGCWDDDCEILRSWGPMAVISTGDPQIVAGIERLCEGLWFHSVIPQYGFSGYGDAEHCSEPSTDSEPTMMILHWGDPLWIERNMRSAKTIRDIYMGVDQTGHYRFRSGFYGADIVGKNPQQEGDVHYNTRTMKHLQMLSYWGNKEARRVYLSWVDGWLEQTMKAYPSKPAGVVPGQLFFPTGTPIPPYGKPKDWVSCNAPNPDAPPEMGGMIHGGFLAGYRLTGDRRYLEPMRQYLFRTSYGPLFRFESKPKPGTKEWVFAGQQGDTQTDTVASYRWLSGDKTSDEYLMRFATPYQQYMVTNNLDQLIKGVETAAKSMRTDFRLMTDELLQTDRAALPMGDASVGAYTGALHEWSNGLTPTMAVTWETPDPNFAALVVASTDERLRVWVYSFHDEPVRMGMRIWRLTPGIYAASHGEIMKGEGRGNLRYGWSDPENFTFRRRLDTYSVNVPPRTAYAIDLRLLQPIEVPATSPDAAIANRDLAMPSPGTLTTVVHNLGSDSMSNVLVVLEARDDAGGWKRIAEQHTGDLPAPGFDPVTQKITFEKVPSAPAYRVVLDPDNQLDELFEGNNIAILTTQTR